MTDRNKVASVILCTHNRASLLKRTLDSLVCQTNEPEMFEVIVVDDGSDDLTQEVVREMSARQSLIRFVSTEDNKGPSHARNLGLTSATGNYILFTDDDCVAKEDWIEEMCAALDREPIVAGSIGSPKSGYTKLCHNIAHFHPFMPGRKSGPVDFVACANMGIRRDVIDELDGFKDEMRLAGDMELCLRARSIGYRPCLIQEAVVMHDPDYISLAGALKSAYSHAATAILLRNKYRSLLRTPFALKYPPLILLASPLIALNVTFRIYRKNPRLMKLFWTAPFVFVLKLIWCFGAASGLKRSKKKEKADIGRNN